ncbi:hypothetical protein AB3N59_19730 [Leptospira sp. WS92.C1]
MNKAINQNPFDITKAVDFTDQEINDFWVELPHRLNPNSPMPIYFMGGKGSGKTHIMRYHSYPLQKIRHRINLLEGIKNDGYIGIYGRCGGFNSDRFNGKGQSNEIWKEVFGYYVELWLAQLLLYSISDLLNDNESYLKNEILIINEIKSLFVNKTEISANSLSEILEYVINLQRDIDIAVNDCAFTRKLDLHQVRARVIPTNLIFGIPKVLSKYIAMLSDVNYLYLIDEFENIDKDKQEHFNTLIRERSHPTTFRIGGRIYGFRTNITRSAGEENKIGSEYEIVNLDEMFRNEDLYETYAREICIRRLNKINYFDFGHSGKENYTNITDIKIIDKYFEDDNTNHSEVALSFVRSQYKERHRPYFEKLKKNLQEGILKKIAFGVFTDGDVELIISNLKIDENPLVEKLNLFFLYQAWSKKRNLIDASKEIKVEAKRYLTDKDRTSKHSKKLKRAKGDLLAQIFRDCRKKQRYTGLNNFIAMSEGIPRNLLIILKYIYEWALIHEEEPFKSVEKPIGWESQTKGVLKAAQWFLDDARSPDPDGMKIRFGINKIGTLFQKIRFSDKSTFDSLLTFEFNVNEIDIDVRNLIEQAQKWSLLIKQTKEARLAQTNTKKYKINSLLSPIWDLPIKSGGTLLLDNLQLKNLFQVNSNNAADIIIKEISDRMNAPNFGESKKKRNKLEQGTLFPE